MRLGGIVLLAAFPPPTHTLNPNEPEKALHICIVFLTPHGYHLNSGLAQAIEKLCPDKASPLTGLSEVSTFSSIFRGATQCFSPYFGGSAGWWVKIRRSYLVLVLRGANLNESFFGW